jgi:hypothetical protein
MARALCCRLCLSTALRRLSFHHPEPSEERTDIKTEGFPWPGEWTVERDEARHKTTVHWKGKREALIRGERKRTTKSDL